MGYPIEIEKDGAICRVECQTWEQVKELLLEVTTTAHVVDVPVVNKNNGESVVELDNSLFADEKPESQTERDRVSAIRLLKAIKAAGAEGATTQNLVEATGVENCRVLGGKLTRINAVFSAHGYSADDLFETERNRSGGRNQMVRKAKARIDSAIRALSNKPSTQD